MRELNIEFQEQYKQLDKLCRDMYRSDEGVSAYIRDMESTPYNKRYAVRDWDACYKQLKHMRWMRNRLAHDISIDTDFCKRSDIEWIRHFRNSILQGNDPLAVAYRAKRRSASQTPAANKKTAPDSTYQEKQHKSLWQRIIAKFRSWFS